jgi:malate dehydrogenase (oxaloacetate-decarboxylating)(NADP+)
MGRNGVTPKPPSCRAPLNTLIAALMVHLGDADAMLCGLVGVRQPPGPSGRFWA